MRLNTASYGRIGGVDTNFTPITDGGERSLYPQKDAAWFPQPVSMAGGEKTVAAKDRTPHV